VGDAGAQLPPEGQTSEATTRAQSPSVVLPRLAPAAPPLRSTSRRATRRQEPVGRAALARADCESGAWRRRRPTGCGVITKSAAAKPKSVSTRILPRSRDRTARPSRWRAVSVGRAADDVVIHRQREQERHQHDEPDGHRRERAGRFDRDRRQVGQRTEVIEPDQAEHERPGAGAVCAGGVWCARRLRDASRVNHVGPTRKSERGTRRSAEAAHGGYCSSFPRSAFRVRRHGFTASSSGSSPVSMSRGALVQHAGRDRSQAKNRPMMSVPALDDVVMIVDGQQVAPRRT